MLILSSVLLLSNSCTDVNDLVGSSIIPSDQVMSVGIDTIYNIQTSLYYADSTYATNAGMFMLGKSTSSIYGKTTTGFFAQFSPDEFNENYDEDDDDDWELFGYSPIADSLILTLPLYAYDDGDTTVTQSINVYLVTTSISRDSTYYKNFNYEDFIDPTPIATASFRGSNVTGIRIPIDYNSLGAELLDITDEVYDYDTLFLERFKGLVIKTTDDSPDNAAIYAVTPTSTALELYYRTHDKDYNVVDTTSVVYTFTDAIYSLTYNTSIGLVSHDYSDSMIDVIEGEDVIYDGDPVEVETAYIQGFGGVGTRLRFTDEFVDHVASLIDYDNGYNYIAINKAELTIYIDEVSFDKQKILPSRIGMYTNYTKLYPVKDYYYYFESSLTLAYGGYYDASTSTYTMDISSYVNSLLNDPDDTQQDVILAPEYASLLVYQEAPIFGSLSMYPPKVVLTYTLIK